MLKNDLQLQKDRALTFDSNTTYMSCQAHKQCLAFFLYMTNIVIATSKRYKCLPCQYADCRILKAETLVH